MGIYGLGRSYGRVKPENIIKATIFSELEGQPLRILVVLESPLIDQAN